MKGSSNLSERISLAALFVAIFLASDRLQQGEAQGLGLSFGQNLLNNLNAGLAGIGQLPTAPPLTGAPNPDDLIIALPTNLPQPDELNVGGTPAVNQPATTTTTTQAPNAEVFMPGGTPMVPDYDPVFNIMDPFKEFRKDFKARRLGGPRTADFSYEFAESIRNEIIPVKPRSRLDVDLVQVQQEAEDLYHYY